MSIAHVDRRIEDLPAEERLLHEVRVPLIEGDEERSRFDEFLTREHSLRKPNAIGQVLRYVAGYRSEWVSIVDVRFYGSSPQWMDSLWQHVRMQLPDPRKSRAIRHPLPTVICLATLAIAAGCQGPHAIAEFAESLNHDQRRQLRCRPRPGTRR